MTLAGLSDWLRTIRARHCIWPAGIVTLAVALRVLVAMQQYPMGGDPLFSYSYRGLLLSRGEWEGLFLIWHPPGMPILIALGIALSGFLLSPYVIGTLIAIASFVLVVLLTDRLLQEMSLPVEARLVSVAFLCFYDLMFFSGTAPLTEMPFLAAVLGAAVLALGGRMRQRVAAGLLLGGAGLLRSEGLVVIAGFLIWQAFVGWSSSGRSKRVRAALARVTPVTLGSAVPLALYAAAGDYFELSWPYGAAGLTVPSPTGALLDPDRVARSFYHAATEWLPRVVLLPFWLLAGLGLGAGMARPRARAVLGVLAAVVLPNLLLTSLTIMHRRTGTFLLPSVALLLALSVAWAREQSDRGHRALLAFVRVGFWAFMTLQLVRLPVAPPRGIGDGHGFPETIAAALRNRSCREMPVYAFGSEPEIYALSQFAVVYPFFERETWYNRIYSQNRGRPSDFVASLQGGGFGYLAFVIGRSDEGSGKGTEEQPYGGFGGNPERRDLEILIESGQDVGARVVGRWPLQGGEAEAVLLGIEHDLGDVPCAEDKGNLG